MLRETMLGTEPTHLSLGPNYVGFINQQLRTLEGSISLANELIQNAEDAGATEITFSFRNDALVVSNNKGFTKCSDIASDLCKNENSNSKSCDFHCFRDVASGNKRVDNDNIGAFGIGFTSVYQITDSPQLSSGDIRWIINPMNVENQRVDHKVVPEAIGGTEFVFPVVS